MEDENEHEEELGRVLFLFVDDEMDDGISQSEIVQTVGNHTLVAIMRAQEMRKSAG